MGVINRVVDPNRRMMRQHPFDVWRVLVALQFRNRMINEDDRFYNSYQVAQVLYSNFDDLSLADQNRVVRLKLDCAFYCLKNSPFAEEEKERKEIRDRFGFRDISFEGKGNLRARHVFNFAGYNRENRLRATRDSLDRDWGMYIVRRGAVDRYLRKFG